MGQGRGEVLRGAGENRKVGSACECACTASVHAGGGNDTTWRDTHIHLRALMGKRFPLALVQVGDNPANVFLALAGARLPHRRQHLVTIALEMTPKLFLGLALLLVQLCAHGAERLVHLGETFLGDHLLLGSASLAPGVVERIDLTGTQARIPHDVPCAPHGRLGHPRLEIINDLFTLFQQPCTILTHGCIA